MHVKGIHSRRYLSNPGGFALKEFKVVVISAILEDLIAGACEGIHGRRYLNNQTRFDLKKSRLLLSQQMHTV